MFKSGDIVRVTDLSYSQWVSSGPMLVISVSDIEPWAHENQHGEVFVWIYPLNPAAKAGEPNRTGGFYPGNVRHD